ncbi:MAG: hypothetical protein OEW46_06560, partial [Actinomycetota bacterium]|nr:hypothetical protein [Actinomycetota bacterium]
MEPLPEEAPPGAYGGSRLTTGFDIPDARAFAGRGDLATAEPEGDAGALDGEILQAIADQGSWMTD